MNVVCAVCGGPIFRHEIVRGRPNGPWLHLHDEDWKDHPHDAVPVEPAEATS